MPNRKKKPQTTTHVTKTLEESENPKTLWGPLVQQGHYAKMRATSFALFYRYIASPFLPSLKMNWKLVYWYIWCHLSIFPITFSTCVWQKKRLISLITWVSLGIKMWFWCCSKHPESPWLDLGDAPWLQLIFFPLTRNAEEILHRDEGSRTSLTQKTGEVLQRNKGSGTSLFVGCLVL